ncbi:MAG: HAMP domain-containing histidine kinase [Cryomorphaceae bacterium]|nr:HAMP domain-containing histidine kinase [Cryomorphaceae bacterium]
MKKIRVKFIFSVVVTALLALLIIQAFQTLQLYDRKKTQYETNLSTSLERIAIRHEKAEDIRRYLHIVDRDFRGQYKDILKQEFKDLIAAKESVSIKDTILFENGERHNYLIITGSSYDSLTGLSTEQKVMARDVRELRDLFDNPRRGLPNSDSIRLSIQLDQRVTEQIFRKARFINELMVETFRENVYTHPDKRIDVVFLDSVIRTELANDDLPHTYRFMVANQLGVPIHFRHFPPTYTLKLDTLVSGKTKLFPSNILDEDLYLYIYFPKKGMFLIKEMWSSFFISLTLIMLIVTALIFMFKTIVTQERFSEMKNDFISNMTHEFKTPISTISLACEALGDKDMVTSGKNEEIAPYVKMISDENKRLGTLVERILQSAVIDRGELRLQSELVSLNDVLKEVCQHAQFRVEAMGGQLSLELPNESLQIETDRLHLTNVISNLVDNAIKYSDKAPIIVVSLSRDTKKIRLSVKDRGIGIRKEYLSKIFDKLYRIPTGNVHNVKGFGLGLSYVKAIADLQGWQIQVKSKVGVGTEFIVIINE